MPTDGSPDADPLIALGERIVAELGDPRTNNTLARWLAHHTARLIHEADTARQTGAPDADICEARAREAILQLWQARARWPAGWPPPHAAEIARMLDDLPSLDDENGWYRQTVLAHLQDVHYHVMAVLIDLISGDGADIEQGWLDTFGEHLTSEEVLLLRRATTRPRRIESLLRWSDRKVSSRDDMTVGEDADKTPEPPAHPLLELADAYHETIASLIQRATATAETKVSTSTQVGAETGTNEAQLRWRVAPHLRADTRESAAKLCAE
jgi:hypothetical protein